MTSKTETEAEVLTLEQDAEDYLDDARYEEALATADKAIGLEPNSIAAWIVRAYASKAMGQFWDAADALEAVLTRVSGLADIRVNLANIYAALERFSKAESHLLEAIRLEPNLAAAYANLGSVYLRMARYDLAEAPSRQALSLDPSNVAAQQNLLAILEYRQNADSAVSHRSEKHEQILIEPAPAPAPTILVLTSSGGGNVPYPDLIPRANFTRVLWFLEHSQAGGEPTLPPYDLVFNAVGDPDASPAAQQAAQDFAKLCQKPLINRPDNVARTGRSAMPGLLQGIKDVLLPSTKRFDSRNGDLIQAILASGLRFPLILRPVGSHGGKGARRVDAPSALPSSIPDCEALYATEFIDYRCADGWYRKYRIIFVDRKPYPYHLAIGKDWMVHYWTAGMEQDRQRREAEELFLCNFEKAIGPRAVGAVNAIAAKLDLDYAGLDFSVLPEGRLLFFEANATMLVHPEDDPVFAYKNQAVRTILEATATMIRQRAA